MSPLKPSHPDKHCIIENGPEQATSICKSHLDGSIGCDARILDSAEIYWLTRTSLAVCANQFKHRRFATAEEPNSLCDK